VPFHEAVRLALAQIRVQKLKSFFTLLGVTIGVMFLIAVVSIVEGMGRYMEEEFVGKLMGINTFELRHRPSITMGNVTEAQWRAWQRRPRLMRYDIPPVVAALPPDAKWSALSEDNVPVSTRTQPPREVQGYAVDGAYFEIKKMGVSSGRLFSPQEYALGSPVVVIGQDVRNRFFPNLDPIGRELRIAGLPYRIVGVGEPQGSVFGFSLDKYVIAPLSSPMARALNRRPGVIDGITIQSPSTMGMAEAMERVRQVMRGRHKLRPAEPDDFSITTSDTALEFWTKIKSYLVIAGIALPAIGLVVGAIVIMNIMLMAVAQRTREIGIRKSLGARRRDIMAQFLVESATLSTMGAVIGILLGIVISQGMAIKWPFLPALIAPWSIGVASLLGIGVGTIAGVYPARRAARLDPVEALRHE
jgi:putative ABC transport system permease protein